jgi:hypothetical protein
MDNQLLDLRKDIVLDLKKNSGIQGLVAQVALVLDCSGSMGHLFESGNVKKTIERILPLGLAFDDNGSVEVYLFHNTCMKMPDNLTRENLPTYMDKINKSGFLYGGTSYAPAIRRIVKDYSETGFLGNAKKMQHPVYVIYITDGECDDRQAAQEAIRNASSHAIYFQFVGIGSADFDFLKRLDDLSGRKIDNAGFVKVADMSAGDDTQVYSLLLKEFPTFVSQAKQLSMI